MAPPPVLRSLVFTKPLGGGDQQSDWRVQERRTKALEPGGLDSPFQVAPKGEGEPARLLGQKWSSRCFVWRKEGTCWALGGRGASCRWREGRAGGKAGRGLRRAEAAPEGAGPMKCRLGVPLVWKLVLWQKIVKKTALPAACRGEGRHGCWRWTRSVSVLRGWRRGSPRSHQRAEMCGKRWCGTSPSTSPSKAPTPSAVSLQGPCGAEGGTPGQSQPQPPAHHRPSAGPLHQPDTVPPGRFPPFFLLPPSSSP